MAATAFGALARGKHAGDGFSNVSTVAELDEVMSGYYGPVRTVPLGDGRFGARMHTRRNNDVVIGAVRARGHSLERTKALIGEVEPTYMNFALVLAGNGQVQQSGRTAHVGPGDMFMNDPDIPYSMGFHDSFHLIYFLFPRKMVSLSAMNLGNICARTIPADGDLSRFVRPFLTQFDERFGTLGERTGNRMVHGALDLIGTVAQEVLDTDILGDPTVAHRQSLLTQAKDYIEANLSDPNLSPTRAAEALFISPRHLHGIFQPEGTTVAAWIREQRLEKVRRDLSDPRQLHHPLSIIGERWGFDEASHFSRVFRAAFGMSPRQYRDRAAMEQATLAS